MAFGRGGLSGFGVGVGEKRRDEGGASNEGNERTAADTDTGLAQ